MAVTRRQFLCRLVRRIGRGQLWVSSISVCFRRSHRAGDYKALVCIFLFGGNDAGNMIIPYDDYATYAAVRQSAGLAIPQSSLLPIDVPGCWQPIRASIRA